MAAGADAGTGAGRRVGVVFGGRSVEHQVSIRSARAVTAALAEAGFAVHPLGIALDGCWVDPAAARAALAGEVDTLEAAGGDPRASLEQLLSAPVDVAFPLVHGTFGEDGTMQGLFEMLDLPYVGAGVTASAVAMDKVQCKRLLETAGIRTVEFVALDRRGWQADPAAGLARIHAMWETSLATAAFVKPSVGGSSVGVQRVARESELAAAIDLAFRFDDQVLVERAVPGREIECAVLGYETLEASAVGEIVPGREFYDYADKYLEDTARLEAPAVLAPTLADRVRATAIRAFAAIGGAGLARVDFLLEKSTAGDDKLYVNELNTLPGFTSISMYPKLWELSGVPLPDLVIRLVEIADRRHADRRRLNDGIRDWIRGL
ncbi:MAG: D-alanine--D-alanine ligase [Acidobacteriota bacterium]|nr:D-alanine--D-alanine ligase [Acidobacteriota bacterium]